MPPILIVAGALAVLGVAIALVPQAAREGASLADAPWIALDGITQFPPAEPDLPPATPLAPLLVADAPEALAVLSPSEGATRVVRGETLLVRFNRPMVRGSEVGRPLAASPIGFEPAVPGQWRWTTRSSLLFTPAVFAFDRSLEASLVVGEEVASLDGESLYDDVPRVVVFDGSPRLLGHQSTVAEGQPLTVTFDARVSDADLAREMFAWELQGRRPVPLRISESGFVAQTDPDAPPRFEVRLAPERTLEAGAQIALAFAPRWDRYGGSYPRVVQFSLAPRPRITGIGCEESQWGTARCTFSSDPGQIVDIGPALRLLASEALAEVSAGDVRITPPLADLQVRLEGQGSETGRVIAIRGEWAPDQVYEVRLGALRTANGNPVVALAPLAVRSAGHWPEVHGPSGMLAYEADAPISLRLRGIHVDEGRAILRPVPEGREVEALLSPATFAAAEQPITVPLSTLLPDARPNRWGRGALDVRALASDARMMVVALQPGPRSTATDLQAAFVQTTDLGVTAQALDRGVLVWVSSIARATPVEGARVELRSPQGQVIADARTDAMGAAYVRSDGMRGSTVEWAPLSQTTAIVVRAANDRAVLALDPRRAVGPGALGVPQTGAAADEEDAPIRASVIADRGAYRPGEPMRVLAIARRIQGAIARPPSDQRVRFRLVSGSAETPIAEARAELVAGHADAGWTLPEGVPLGEHQLELVGANDVVLGATTVTIAEFRQPQFRVDLAPPAADIHDRAALEIAASARYLFGAPLEGATMRWSIAREGRATFPTQWDEYAFGPAAGGARAGTLAEGESTLDRTGSATLSAEVALAQAVRTRLRVEAEVTDATGQTTSASRTLTAYPASFEVGVRRTRSWQSLGTELAIDAVAVDHANEAVEGRAIEARFVREGWHGWWEWHDGEAEDDGAYQMRRGQRREVVETCALNTALEPVRCAFTPARAGTYVLEVEGRDEAGRTTLAQTRVYVAGPDEHPDRDPPGAPIALTPSREEWSVGEEAELAFESPWGEAEVLVAVHHGALISMERRHVGAGGQVLRVPLTDAMVPNVFVTIALVRPRTGEPSERIDLHAPDLRFGSASLQVRPRTSRLEVAIETQGAARPGTEVPVAVRVLDDGGRPVRNARVAVWAVDEGTLRLTGYQTPDPTNGFFRARGAAFALDDLRRALVSRIEPSIEAEASGDGGYAQGAMDLEERERFDPTPLWAPRLTTDGEGYARVALELPARPTEYRVMAIAVDDGLRRGRAATSVVAEQPLVVRSAFPRFATDGDRFEAVAFVHNAGEAEISAEVQFEVGDEARVARSVTIAAGGEARVAESIAVSGTSTLPLRVVARATVDGAAVEHAAASRVPVVPAARWVRRRAVVGGTGNRALDLGFAAAGARSPRGELRVAVASHPFVGLDGALDALDESFWGGTEADASRLLAIASYLRMSEGLRAGGRDEAELRARALRAIDRVMRARAVDGGFGRWSADEGGLPYETVLAVRALVEARAAGLGVSDGVIEAGLRRLAAMSEQGAFGETYGRAGQESWALAMRLLADAGTRGAAIDALYEQREFASPAALASLALALPESDRRRDTALALAVHRLFPDLAIEGLEPAREGEHARAAYVEVDVPAVAAVLEAASQVTTGRRWIAMLATELLTVMGDASDGLGSPSEVAAAMSALSACAQRFGHEDEPLRATLAIDDRALEPTREGAEGALFDVPWARVAEGPHRLLARAGDDEPLFVALDSRWAVPVGEAETVARGRVVALHRVLETAAGTPITDGARIPLGTMLRVRLFVHLEDSSPERIAVRDPLAAGLESVDAGLRSSPHASLLALLGASPDDDATDARGFHAMRTLSYVEHRAFDTHATTFYLSALPPGLHELTYAVRATTPGEFVMPPATIEALRDDAFVGRSTAMRIIVE